MTATQTQPTLTPENKGGLAFKVKDLSLAEWGLKELELAEQEMKKATAGLMPQLGGLKIPGLEF